MAGQESTQYCLCIRVEMTNEKLVLLYFLPLLSLLTGLELWKKTKKKSPLMSQTL